MPFQRDSFEVIFNICLLRQFFNPFLFTWISAKRNDLARFLSLQTSISQ